MKYVPDVEIIDYASASKPDTPSGTGRELAETLGAERMAATSKPVSELGGARETARRGDRRASPGPGALPRMPGFVLSCEAVFGLPDERLVIRHDAGTSAAPYVGGTLRSARKVSEKIGLRRGLDSLMTKSAGNRWNNADF